MLSIKVPSKEWFDDDTGQFYTTPACELKLEHSLIAISKWESKWCVPFLDKFIKKTNEMTIDYIRCMTINGNVPNYVYYTLTDENLEEITKYINAPMTATTFCNFGHKTNVSEDIVTSEIIYLMMFKHGIPKECEKWHLNRLITMIKAADELSKEPEKMSEEEYMAQMRKLNEERKRKYGTHG